MRGLIGVSLGTTCSVACAFMAVGVALYGGTDRTAAAAWLYAGFGLAAGGVCSVLDLAWRRLPSRVRAADPARRAWALAGADARAEASVHPSRFGA